MIGYAFWGFLGDVKYGDGGEVLSTPDGNAFYSWSILHELHKRGKNVVNLMDNRDRAGYEIEGRNLFSAFATEARHSAYIKSGLGWQRPEPWEYMLIEWRWPIPGRNTPEDKGKPGYQHDLELMVSLIEDCNNNGIPFVVFDLDYKLTIEDIMKYKIKNVIELGTKWKQYEKSLGIQAKQVKIPFDFSYIHDLPIKDNCSCDFVYVGNRYERDWCIDKYIPDGAVGMVYGNWLEGEKDSADRWKYIAFGNRLQTRDMYKVYSDAMVTPLLAKREYCEQGFMTARLVEAVCYACVPLFIEEFGEACIQEYAGKYTSLLTIRNKHDIIRMSEMFRQDMQLRTDVIEYLRNHLRFMDSKFFVDDVERMMAREAHSSK